LELRAEKGLKKRLKHLHRPPHKNHQSQNHLHDLPRHGHENLHQNQSFKALRFMGGKLMFYEDD